MLPPCELEERGSKAVMIIKVFLMSPSRGKRTGGNLNKLSRCEAVAYVCIHNTIGYIALQQSSQEDLNKLWEYHTQIY
jgi:hypothetical protein